MNRNSGFSLIELMIVLTIIGILAAIAVPSYQSYVLRTKISTALPILNELKNRLVEVYQVTGAWPASIDMGGTTITGAAWTPYAAGQVKVISYNTSGAQLITEVSLTGLTGIPGFVEPTTTYGSKSVISQVTFQQNGTFRSVCGQWTATHPGVIPLQYLPSSCQCTVLQTVYSGTLNACD